MASRGAFWVWGLSYSRDPDFGRKIREDVVSTHRNPFSSFWGVPYGIRKQGGTTMEPVGKVRGWAWDLWLTFLWGRLN